VTEDDENEIIALQDCTHLPRTGNRPSTSFEETKLSVIYKHRHVSEPGMRAENPQDSTTGFLEEEEPVVTGMVDSVT